MSELDAEQLDEILERWQQAMEAFQPTFEALREAFKEVFKVILSWWIAIRRQYLYQRLRKWHFPHWLARFLSQYWPRRFLPKPQFNHDVGD